MKNKNKVFIIVLLCILILLDVVLTVCNFHSINKYSNRVLPNTYIDKIDISKLSFKDLNKKFDSSCVNVLSKKIKLKANGNDYEYSMVDLGVEIDKDKTIKEIKKYQEKMSYIDKLMNINGTVNKNFTFTYRVNEEKLNEVLNNLKTNIDVQVVNGYFDLSEGVKYNTGVSGYSLNVDESSKNIVKVLNNKVVDEVEIDLTGSVIDAVSDSNYATIDTMTSSFVTTFIPNTYLRNINLEKALSLVNGTIVNPGEIFSYCNVAGPFNREGYVFYYEFVGNGVCQIATTTYNAALLGGLEIVKRYPHAKKSAYVPGGLDATVASYSSGWCVDMQFKNTYQYPIYIKAYSEGGRAHVEFWSNSQAKGGYEYSTSSTKIGVRGYRTYLHKWKDGEEVDVSEIATTWYTEE